MRLHRSKYTSLILYLPLLAMLLFWFFASRSEPAGRTAVAYSTFEGYLKQGLVESVVIHGDRIEGSLKRPLPDGTERFSTVRVAPDVAAHLEEYGVQYEAIVESTWFLQILSWIVPLLLLLGFWAFMMRRMPQSQGGGFMSVGKSKAKVYVETDTTVTFADVAGVDEAKDELKELVDFLKDPGRYGRLGARVPKGVLLIGPPGTGKTLLARAVAGEAGVPFFSISGSEFVEMFVGVGAARVRDLFEQARQRAPAIIFIDELDALGRMRGVNGYGGGHDEKEQTLNQLLSELDGFDVSRGLILLAATNRPEILDPALLRAGRFDRQILVDRPDKTGRLQILKVHLTKIRLSQDMEPGQIAAITPGFSGADLANLVNEAALLATRRGANAVGQEDFTSAIERIVAGLEKKNRVISVKERRTVAYHEMGHALVATGIPGSDPIHKISIIPRGIGALGYTMQRPTEDRFLMSRSELENKLAVLLGGRAAEHIAIGEYSTGAADDLAKATEIARSMATRYGMEPNLGPVTYASEAPNMLGGHPSREVRPVSEETAREIDVSVKAILVEAFERAVSILADRRALLEHGAAELLSKETLTSEELGVILARANTRS